MTQTLSPNPRLFASEASFDRLRPAAALGLDTKRRAPLLRPYIQDCLNQKYLCIYAYIHTYIGIYPYLYLSIYRYRYRYIYIYICIHTYLFVYVFICSYAHTHNTAQTHEGTQKPVESPPQIQTTPIKSPKPSAKPQNPNSRKPKP